MRWWLIACLIISTHSVSAYRVEALAGADDKPVDLEPVSEKHVMIPMRDGVKLSAYLFFPKGKGPWPVLYEQRYASVRSHASHIIAPVRAR